MAAAKTGAGDEVKLGLSSAQSSMPEGEPVLLVLEGPLV